MAEQIEAPAFCEWPIMLYHPKHRAAIYDKANILQRVEEEVFPPKVAQSEQHENELRKEGYRRHGEPDSKSFERAFEILAGSPPVHVVEPFPMWVKTSADAPARIVSDAQEYATVMGEPWVENAAPAPEDKPNAVTQPAKAKAKPRKRRRARPSARRNRPAVPVTSAAEASEQNLVAMEPAA